MNKEEKMTWLDYIITHGTSVVVITLTSVAIAMTATSKINQEED